MKESNLPFITVSMPVRDEAKFIRKTLNQLLRQDYPFDRFEIIVADGESSDSTREIVRVIAQKNPQVILKSNPGKLPSSGRNVGFRNGKGDIFLVIDGHCLIKDNNLLRNVAECFKKSKASCLGRPQPFIIPESLTVQRAIAIARSSRLGHSGNSLIHSRKEGFVSPVSVGCAYKKEVFNKIGYVDESFDACEDVEFNYRVEKAGFRTYFSPEIAVYYYARDNISGLLRQLIRYGKGRIQFMAKHKETINMDMFLPLLFVCCLVFGPLAGFINIYLLYLYILVLLVYLSVTLFESMKLCRGNGFRFTMKTFSVFIVIHTSLGLSLAKGFFEILRHRRSNPKVYYEKDSITLK